MRKNVVLLSVFLTLGTLPNDVRADPLTLSGLSHFQLDFEGDLFFFIGSSFDLRGLYGNRCIHSASSSPEL